MTSDEVKLNTIPFHTYIYTVYDFDVMRTKFLKWRKVDCCILRLKVGHAIVFGF